MIDVLQAIAREHGTPSYVYCIDETYDKLAKLYRVFGTRFHISYAVKSNPNPGILKRLRGKVDYLDISSGGELRKALQTGWSPKLISFTGPVKQDEELQAAVSHRIGEVIVESVEEARRLSTLARDAGQRQRILIRVTPMKLPRGFGVNMAGKPSQFGIDEEDLPSAIEMIAELPSLEIKGLHIYSGTQCLDARAVAENYEIFTNIFKQFCTSHRLVPEKLIFGSGLGIPYHENDHPIDLDAIAQRMNPQLDALRQTGQFEHTRFVLEIGRYLIGEAGFYLTRVVNKKHSRGSTICMCDGGMNHHLGACGHLGSIIHRNYRMFKVADLGRNTIEEEPYELVGPLCTSIDTLGHGVKFPGLEIGDVIAIHCSGAYGVTASPMGFISRPPPKEFVVEMLDGNPSIEDVSQFTALYG